MCFVSMLFYLFFFFLQKVDVASVVECETLLKQLTSKFEEVLEVISNLVDLFVGSHPQVINVAVTLKVRHERNTEKAKILIITQNLENNGRQLLKFIVPIFDLVKVLSL